MSSPGLTEYVRPHLNRPSCMVMIPKMDKLIGYMSVHNMFKLPTHLKEFKKDYNFIYFILEKIDLFNCIDIKSIS